MKLTQQQAEQLAKIARDLTIDMSKKTVAFCEQHGLDTPSGFDAALLTLNVSHLFFLLEGMFDSPADRRKAADQIHADVRGLLRNHAIHLQVQKIRNPH